MGENAPARGRAAQIRLVTGRTLAMLGAVERPSGSRMVLAGRALPARPGDCLEGELRALCTRPGEWLLVSSAPPAARWHAGIETDLRRANLRLVDVSDAFAVIEVRGPTAREVLSQGSGVDFHARAFPRGRCARTRFAQIPLLVDCCELEAFDLYVARSYLRYLRLWLLDALGAPPGCAAS